MAEMTVRELADEVIEAIEERICGRLTPREKQRLRPDLEWPIRRIDAELLDQRSEDTEKQSAGITQLTPKQREQISTVQGHLEGYASMLDILGAGANLDTLPEDLREDAEKLKLSAGEDRS